MKKTNIYKITPQYAQHYNFSSALIGKEIVLFDDRIQHFSKHANEYVNLNSYNYALNHIDDIIKNPDFISKNSNNNGLEFVKSFSDNVLVAVRVSNSNSLKIKSMYPISNVKKQRLINNI